MNTERIVVFQTFSDPINANIVKGLLDSYGIECFLTDENMANLYAQYNQVIGGVKLNVFEKDIERINLLLKAENIDPVLQLSSENDTAGMICPKCNSNNVGYGGSVNQKFGLLNVLFFAFLNLMTFVNYPFSQRKAYHCFDCGHEFKKSVKPNFQV